ncbi:MAG: RsmE family RNA methyltransferase, partial [Lentisphaeria bacterium]
TTPPPAPSPITLCVALPRPQTLKKLLQGAIELGVKKIIFFGSNRVEKSFWNSSILEPDALSKQILLGLEQAVDTIAPEIILVPYFNNFINKSLPLLAENNQLIFAHPNSSNSAICTKTSKPTAIIIGPEGGFIPSEVDKLLEVGCQGVELGERILRVEHAAFFLLSRLN